MIPRAGWGADESRRRGSPIFDPVRKFVVHHTVTGNRDEDPATRIREVYGMHLGRGWSDIGYHYLIDERGTIFEGRWSRRYQSGEPITAEDPFGRGVRGAHAGEANPGTMGVALLGTFVDRRPTDAALDALADLIASKCERHGLDPRASEAHTLDDGRIVRVPTIMGHRDVRNTQCPGGALYRLLPNVRKGVARRMASAGASRADGGCRVLYADGRVVNREGAADRGDLVRLGVQTTAVGLAFAPGTDGFWITDGKGGVFSFGVRYRGSIPGSRLDGSDLRSSHVVDVAATPSGRGYWILDKSGGVYTFGDARFHGSIPELRARGARVGRTRPVAIAPTHTGRGYWILDERGGVFTFGDARFHGSIPELRARGQAADDVAAVDLQAVPGRRGYWILDEGGGVYTFGKGRYHGSPLESGFRGADARRLRPTRDGAGYTVLLGDGAVLPFGSAHHHGHGPRLAAVDVMPVS